MPRDFDSIFVWNIEKLYCLYFCQEKLLQSYKNYPKISGKCHWRVYFSQKELWNISAGSFKSTCEKVELLKKFATYELFHWWFLRFSVYRSLFVSYGWHILYSYSHLQKVFLLAFTIPEIENEGKIPLSF